MGPQRGLPEDFVVRELLDPRWAEVDEFENKWGIIAFLGKDAAADKSFRTRVDFYRDYPGTIENVEPWFKSALLREIRATARQWLASAEGDEAGAVAAWVAEGFAGPNGTDWIPDYAQLTDQEAAWRRWVETVGGALGRYQLTVSVQLGGWEWSPSSQEETSTVSVITACALQLAEIASEGRRVLLCANETCRNPRFTRQRFGRRKYEDRAHAEGVKYCSPECRKMQSERERRRRRRAEGTD